MLIDCHTHVLGFGDQQVVVEFMKGALTCVYRTQGKLPVHSLPTEKDWESLELTGEPIDPIQLLKDHEIFDKIVISIYWNSGNRSINLHAQSAIFAIRCFNRHGNCHPVTLYGIFVFVSYH